MRRNIELDKPQGRACVAKHLGRSEPAAPATPPHNRRKRGDSSRHARDKKSTAPAGPWNNNYVKSRLCGGSHYVAPRLPQAPQERQRLQKSAIEQHDRNRLRRRHRRRKARRCNRRRAAR
eukprot:5961076-Pleurochrysis_carterae.AAC.1